MSTSLANTFDDPIDLEESAEDRAGFSRRIRLLVQKVGSADKLARLAGLSPRVVGKYLSGESDPSRGRLVALANAAGVSLEWLAAGKGPTYDEEKEYAYIPLYDVRASAGPGSFVETEQVMSALAFKQNWIRAELRATPADLSLVRVDGESMEPTLRPGDLILVDRREAPSLPQDGIYVVRLDGMLCVKRLQRLPGRQIRVSSDNPAYGPFVIQMDQPDESFAIQGRVIWTCRRM